MKMPARLLTQSGSINTFADRELLKDNSRSNAKVKGINIKINNELYKKLLKESDKKLIVMSELIREALQNFLNEPDKTHDVELLKDNVTTISFTIDLVFNSKMDSFKEKYKVSKSDQIRKALAIRYGS